MQENHSNINVESSKEIEEQMGQPAKTSIPTAENIEESGAEKDMGDKTSSEGSTEDQQHIGDEANSDQLYTLEVVDPDEQSDDLAEY